MVCDELCRYISYRHSTLCAVVDCDHVGQLNHYLQEPSFLLVDTRRKRFTRFSLAEAMLLAFGEFLTLFQEIAFIFIRHDLVGVKFSHNTGKIIVSFVAMVPILIGPSLEIR